MLYKCIHGLPIAGLGGREGKIIIIISAQEYNKVTYSGKLSREKTFTNFVVLEPPVKVFSMKFGRAVLILCLILVFRESFLCEIVTLTDLQKFSPSKFPAIQYY